MEKNWELLALDTFLSKARNFEVYSKVAIIYQFELLISRQFRNILKTKFLILFRFGKNINLH